MVNYISISVKRNCEFGLSVPRQGIIHFLGPRIDSTRDIRYPGKSLPGKKCGHFGAAPTRMADNGHRFICIDLAMPRQYFSQRDRDALRQRCDIDLPGFPDVEELPGLVCFALRDKFCWRNVLVQGACSNPLSVEHPIIRCICPPGGFNSKGKGRFLCNVLQCGNIRLEQVFLLQVLVGTARNQEGAH